MPDEVELLPCPLCGGAVEMGNVSYVTQIEKRHVETVTIWCDDCDMGVARDGVEKAIAAWNTRSDARPTPEETVEVRRCDGCAHWERIDGGMTGACFGVPPATPNALGYIFPRTFESARCPNWTARVPASSAPEVRAGVVPAGDEG